MIVKDEIFTVITKDYDLRMLISKKLNTRETNVSQWGYRKQHAKIIDSRVLKIIKKKLKLSEKDIFEA